VIEGDQLVAHPEEASVLRRCSCTGSHESDDVVTTFNFAESIVYTARPISRVLVVVLIWIRAVIQDGIEWQVLSKVMHPASCSTLFDQIVFNDILIPLIGFWVREVNHSKLD